ncbi:hypothetical protein THRCLA_11847, partial [Thraustotheca clavata]
MDAVLRSRELLAVITAYQNGVSFDLYPLAQYYNQVCRASAIIRRASASRNLLKLIGGFADVFSPWYEEYGHQHLQRLFKSLPYLVSMCFNHAAYYGKMTLLRYLDAKHRRSASMNLANLAALNGQLTALTYLRQHNYEGFSPRTFQYAAQGGDIGTLAYLFGVYPDLAPASTHLVTEAAEAGKMALVEYLCYNHDPSMTRPDAMDGAAENGHLDILQFLYDEGFKCSPEAAVGAALQGHMEILYFLQSHNIVECNSLALLGATRNGHLDAVHFLYEKCAAPVDPGLLNVAITNGHLDLVCYLVANRKAMKLTISPEAIDEACGKGFLDMIKFLHWNTSPNEMTCTTRAMDQAAAHGHLQVVKFLDKYRKEGCTALAMDQAATGGYLDIIQY